MSEMDTPLDHAQDEAFNKSTLRLEDCNVSNRDPSRALSTVGKSQGGTVQGCRELIILAPRKNWVTAISTHQSANNRSMESHIV